MKRRGSIAALSWLFWVHSGLPFQAGLMADRREPQFRNYCLALAQPPDPAFGVLRQNLLATGFRDRHVEYPVERIEGGVRPVRRIEQPVLAAAERHEKLE